MFFKKNILVRNKKSFAQKSRKIYFWISGRIFILNGIFGYSIYVIKPKNGLVKANWIRLFFIFGPIFANIHNSKIHVLHSSLNSEEMLQNILYLSKKKTKALFLKKEIFFQILLFPRFEPRTWSRGRESSAFSHSATQLV